MHRAKNTERNKDARGQLQVFGRRTVYQGNFDKHTQTHTQLYTLIYRFLLQSATVLMLLKTSIILCTKVIFFSTITSRRSIKPNWFYYCNALCTYSDWTAFYVKSWDDKFPIFCYFQSANKDGSYWREDFYTAKHFLSDSHAETKGRCVWNRILFLWHS